MCHLPRFVYDFSQDPHSIVIAHVLKVNVVHLKTREDKR